MFSNIASKVKSKAINLVDDGNLSDDQNISSTEESYDESKSMNSEPVQITPGRLSEINK